MLNNSSCRIENTIVGKKEGAIQKINLKYIMLPHPSEQPPKQVDGEEERRRAPKGGADIFEAALKIWRRSGDETCILAEEEYFEELA